MLAWSMRCGSVLLLGLIGIEGIRVFRKNCSVTTIRFAKTKFPTSVQLFCDCGLLSVLREAEMGRCASDLALFRASIHVLTPAAIRNRKKSCPIFGRISVFGHPDWPHAGAMGGVAWARRLCGRLWAAFCPLWSRAFSLAAIRGRSYPHSIAAPAVLRYHDKNYFKRALKCICVQNKQEKAPSILKKGRIHGFSHLC